MDVWKSDYLSSEDESVCGSVKCRFVAYQEREEEPGDVGDGVDEADAAHVTQLPLAHFAHATPEGRLPSVQLQNLRETIRVETRPTVLLTNWSQAEENCLKNTNQDIPSFQTKSRS